MEKGEGIVYSVPKNVQYEITVQEIPEHKNFTAMCQSAIINGKSYSLHNEITLTFKIIDGKIDVVWGWHIGTEDFTFSKEEGDNCEEYVEDYHPGLLNQLKTKLKEMEYL
jgi:hypothetical protein